MEKIGFGKLIENVSAEPLLIHVTVTVPINLDTILVTGDTFSSTAIPSVKVFTRFRKL